MGSGRVGEVGPGRWDRRGRAGLVEASHVLFLHICIFIRMEECRV